MKYRQNKTVKKYIKYIYSLELEKKKTTKSNFTSFVYLLKYLIHLFLLIFKHSNNKRRRGRKNKTTNKKKTSTKILINSFFFLYLFEKIDYAFVSLMYCQLIHIYIVYNKEEEEDLFN